MKIMSVRARGAEGLRGYVCSRKVCCGSYLSTGHGASRHHALMDATRQQGCQKCYCLHQLHSLTRLTVPGAPWGRG